MSSGPFVNLAGAVPEYGETGSARVTKLHDQRADFRVGITRISRPKRVALRSDNGHVQFRKFTNPFRRLSEKCRSLSPLVRMGVDSPHRRPISEIMTSDWDGEAGWGSCR